HRGRVPEDAGALATVFRGYREYSIFLGNARPEDLPARPALRWQRRWKHHDRGERGQCGRDAPSRHGRGTAPADSRRGLRPEAARFSLPDLFPELSGTCFSLSKLKMCSARQSSMHWWLVFLRSLPGLSMVGSALAASPAPDNLLRSVPLRFEQD